MKEALSFFWGLHRQSTGGILADEMGLGKTLEVLAFFASLHFTDTLNNSLLLPSGVLIVSPATVVRQWISESHRWYPAFRCVTLMRKSMKERRRIATACTERGRICLVSYETMRSDVVIDLIIKYNESFFINFSFAHFIYSIHMILYESDEKSFQGYLHKLPWSYVVLDEGQKIRNPMAGVTIAAKKVEYFIISIFYNNSHPVSDISPIGIIWKSNSE